MKTITIKNPKTNKNRNVVLKHNKTDKLLCSCNGKYTKASDCNAFVFDETNRTLKCPEVVEKILVGEGLIKPENTMKAISERIALEKEQKEKEFAKREELSDRMKEIHSKINDEFISCNNARELSDSEADEHYFNPDFGKGNVVTYTVTDTEIIQCRNMGDFKTGVAIPYTENVENLIKEFYILNEEFWVD